MRYNKLLQVSPRSGFTLIELLVVCAIIAVLAVASIPRFRTFNANQELNQAVEQVKSDLRVVQNRAVSVTDRACGTDYYYWWGVDFDAHSGEYRLVQSDNEVNPDAGSFREVRTKALPTGFELATDVTVWFKMVTGAVKNAGAVTVRRIDASCPGGDCRDVDISEGGRIE